MSVQSDSQRIRCPCIHVDRLSILFTHQVGVEHSRLHLIYIYLSDADGERIGHARQEIMQHGTLSSHLSHIHSDSLRLEEPHEDGQTACTLLLAEQGDVELIVRCLLQQVLYLELYFVHTIVY